MKWGTLGNPFQQMTVDSSWIPNTVRKKPNSNALRNAPKYSPHAKNIVTVPEINHTVINPSLNNRRGIWKRKPRIGSSGGRQSLKVKRQVIVLPDSYDGTDGETGKSSQGNKEIRLFSLRKRIIEYSVIFI